MNARQKAKKLKKDNKFMREIIRNTPDMERLYLAYTRPLKIETNYLPIKTYAACAPIDREFGDRAIEFAKKSVVREMEHFIEKCIEWKMVGEIPFERMEGRIMIAAKE